MFCPFRSKPESRHAPLLAFLDLKSETKTRESESAILLPRVAIREEEQEANVPNSMSLALSLVAH